MLDAAEAPIPEPGPVSPEADPLDEAPIDESGPLLTAQAHPYSEVGGVVEGFPARELPVPEGADLLISSAVPVGKSDVVEVSLNFRSPMTAAELLSVYRASLTEAGFEELQPDVVHDALEVETTFTRSGGDELLVIGVLDDDDSRTVTIGGRMRLSD